MADDDDEAPTGAYPRLSQPVAIGLNTVVSALAGIFAAVGFRQLLPQDPHTAMSLFAFIAAFVICVVGFLQVSRSRVGAALIFVTCVGFLAVGAASFLAQMQVTVHLQAQPRNLGDEHIPEAYATFGSRPSSKVDWGSGADGVLKDRELIGIDLSEMAQYYDDELKARANGSATALTNCQAHPGAPSGGGGI